MGHSPAHAQAFHWYWIWKLDSFLLSFMWFLMTISPLYVTCMLEWYLPIGMNTLTLTSDVATDQDYDLSWTWFGGINDPSVIKSYKCQPIQWSSSHQWHLTMFAKLISWSNVVIFSFNHGSLWVWHYTHFYWRSDLYCSHLQIKWGSFLYCGAS